MTMQPPLMRNTYTRCDGAKHTANAVTSADVRAMLAQKRRFDLFYLAPGIPRRVRCYDNGGETFDRYTVVFTGRYRHKTGGEFWYLGMSCNPFDPQGFGQHGSSQEQIDRPRYSHLGKRIAFEDMPENCRRCAIDTYDSLNDL